MNYRVRRNSRFAKSLGTSGVSFLEHALAAFTRLLPHAETFDWRNVSKATKSVRWADQDRRELRISIGLTFPNVQAGIQCRIRRQRAQSGVGAVSRTLDQRERDVCVCIVEQVSTMMNSLPAGDDVRESLREVFDELVVAAHLKKHHRLGIDLASLFRQTRSLAEQSYENKALSFACIVDRQDVGAAPDDALFPADFLKHKRFRAMSDGYHTAYLVSGKGALRSLQTLSGKATPAHRAFCPEWASDIARHSQGSRLGICLTRHGDILVLDAGSLRFTYRFGRWQYWNHGHLVHMMRNRARSQRVPIRTTSRIADTLYRAALDVSFRRSGALFVLVRKRSNVDSIARKSDLVQGSLRSPTNRAFDAAFKTRPIQTMSRDILVEISALDGAVVVENTGYIMAYGAVLNPRRKGRIDSAEGSRTKAATGASHYGLALKVSSDGDITLFAGGKEVFRV
ncbi:MAG: DNA integrity scanning protein DisA nucleotide-binding domain protein [Planctomycetes bacterium]|nr:DNA integrity scanning protein DisA nucleotide-binding domain protein [Planctomycetota bacterium]